MDSGFLRIYDQYYDMISRYIYIRMGNKWDTDDIVSEVFRKAFENYRTINSNEKAWLFTISRNCMNDFHRRNKTKTVELEELIDDQPPMEEGLVSQDELKCLKASLQCLEDEEYEIIALRYFSELKFKDIADIMGKQNDYLRVKVSRTLKKIANMVSQCMEG